MAELIQCRGLESITMDTCKASGLGFSILLGVVLINQSEQTKDRFKDLADKVCTDFNTDGIDKPSPGAYLLLKDGAELLRELDNELYLKLTYTWEQMFVQLH